VSGSGLGVSFKMLGFFEYFTSVKEFKYICISLTLAKGLRVGRML